ncbi:DUF72 domain-containing protein [soil metagenome]
MADRIRVGVGGWTFEPWEDGVFFPADLPKSKQLHFASRALTAIEVNGTYYSTFKPPTFEKWRDQSPEGFVFTIKASRFCTNRKVLSDGAESIARFTGQGLEVLGDRLGPILWQFMATKKFDAEDFEGFLKLLPREAGGVPLRHAVQVRHDSFHTAQFVDLMRKYGVAVVFADSGKYPEIADVTADFVYARLENAQEDVPTGYAAAELDRWVQVAKGWAAGAQPQALPYAAPAAPAAVTPRDVFVFMINGAKVRAPAAATAFIGRL